MDVSPYANPPACVCVDLQPYYKASTTYKQNNVELEGRSLMLCSWNKWSQSQAHFFKDCMHAVIDVAEVHVSRASGWSHQPNPAVPLTGGSFGTLLSLEWTSNKGITLISAKENGLKFLIEKMTVHNTTKRHTIYHFPPLIPQLHCKLRSELLHYIEVLSQWELATNIQCIYIYVCVLLCCTCSTDRCLVYRYSCSSFLSASLSVSTTCS